MTTPSFDKLNPNLLTTVNFHVIIVHNNDSLWSTVTDDLGDEVYVYGISGEEPGTMSIGSLRSLCESKGYTYTERPMCVPVRRPV